ncbi:MAG TPA: circadian clock protein KaiC [Chitinophagaceae bacterium]
MSIQKTRTGIIGLDEVTLGGIPAGRPTLICGGPGCGKTLFSVEFLVHGANKFNEPGVFVTFEEKTEELTMNVASLGFDLDKLQKQKKLRLDYVRIERNEIEETGEYDLDGLFIRLEHAINSIGAKRVVLDTIENLFAGLTNQGVLRAELRGLFLWLKGKGVTAIVTGEQGDGKLTRHGLEEYVSDCVILLDHRVINQISTRRLRIVKYRGSSHGTNEFPFLIDDEGISVLPVTSLKLDRKVSSERISTGLPTLDEMFGGKGYYRGSSILFSGMAGTGKTSIAAYFVHEACRRGERAIFFAFEESPPQIIRNMRSIGLNLEPHVKKGLLQFHSARPALYGLETHLSNIYKVVRKFKPTTVVLDPVTNLVSVGLANEVNSMLLRLIDFLQGEGITVMLTALIKVMDEKMDEGVSSLVDAWISVKDIESNGERNKVLYVMKARGLKHSNQVREFVITKKGLKLVEIYLGPDGVLLGSEREEQKLRKLKGQDFKDQEERKAMARRRQQNSLAKNTKQKTGK